MFPILTSQPNIQKYRVLNTSKINIVVFSNKSAPRYNTVPALLPQPLLSPCPSPRTKKTKKEDAKIKQKLNGTLPTDP